MERPVSPGRAALSSQHRYVYLQTLGRGGFGLVVKASDTSQEPNATVAIKLLARSRMKPDRFRHIRGELENHARLQHDHVVQFLDVFLLPDYLCIVMEYASAGTLLDYINKGPKKRLEESVARWFFQQLIIAADYCHKRRVASRDIKLDNILLHNVEGLPLPIVKLCDFGYAKGEGLSCSESVVGTVPYMAPEVQGILSTAPERHYNSKFADVWCCGIVLYTLLYAEYPFTEGDAAMLMKKQNRIYPRHENIKISKHCRELLDAMLEPEPHERITIPDILNHPWFLENLPPHVLQWSAERLERSADLPEPATVLKIFVTLNELEGKPQA